MKIVIFSHPDFLNSQSMPLFAGMIYQGMIERGHQVAVWRPKPLFYRLPAAKTLKKWLGYVDQYLVFPLQVKWRLRNTDDDTLFVFADQALGPWVPLVKHRPHVIHCHDFMALHSALGHYSENPVSFTGKLYQAMIRKGFSQGEYFISVSDKTRADLHGFLSKTPRISQRVYNGLNYPYAPLPKSEAQAILQQQGWTVPDSGFLLHVGGNQWYKNRTGVLLIYQAYCLLAGQPLPIFLIGEEPAANLRTLANQMPNKGQVLFLSGLTTQAVQASYSLASAMIFPSIAEGFGWPIAEALACGCPVLTTGEPPMSEVGGEAANYIPVMPAKGSGADWARQCAKQIVALLNLPVDERVAMCHLGLQHAQTFNTDTALDRYAMLYLQALDN